MEAATRKHFFFHGKAGREEEKATCHFCQIRKFSTQAEYPVTIVNRHDDTGLNADFRFVDKSKLGNGVKPARAEFRIGCNCVYGLQCQFADCHCLQELDDDDSQIEAEPSEEPKKAYAYHTHGWKAGHLRSKVLESRAPIYECHESCSCGPDCPNRVVERGRKIPLQIFRTENRGWGVRCPIPIKKGQFIDTYVGEIIAPAEAQKRRDESNIAAKKDVYLFALDKFSDPQSLDERLRGAPLEVDGELMAGPTRFINHSCDPNLRIFARVGDHADKHIHDLAFFAIRDIAKGEELTFDYVDGEAGDDADIHDPELTKDMTRCLCGSKKCRKWLW